MVTETLQEINPDQIHANPENPRLIFREDEMNQLLESIREVGIRVPLSVYEDKNKFVLIDGERRWRCSRRLNLKKVPVIIYPKPNQLENLLMMFNIHNVRKNWDIMPMALKLKVVRDLLEKEGKSFAPKSLAAITGVPVTTVKRAFELLALPKKYQKMLLDEAEKPRHEQLVTPDLFIEINDSFNVIKNYTPDVLKKISKEEYVNAMVDKYVDKVIPNVVGFRELKKIVRAERAGADKDVASKAVIKLIKNKEYKIDQAYKDTVEISYAQRDLSSKIKSITEKLLEVDSMILSDEIRENLINLRNQIDLLLSK